ncbi:putative deacylase [Desulfosporosinus youngiae DSM 17734]|uniref:Putative deacylase n=2 Tax=Desulfosporosinus TaxID=79206 RepID=H5Y4M2_9FIRM|nr:putative deacylase [Desulfosporosinus youngiae DSM 17734]
MEMFELCGHRIPPNEKKQIVIHPNIPDYEIPATVICGGGEGMTLLVTAGIHSGEYPGVAAAIRLARELDPAGINGRLVLVHSVNTSGFWAKSPGRVPEDGANLNANYPGNPQGGAGDRIADYFVRQVFPQVDFIVDLHSGGGMEPLTPCLFFPAAAGEEVRRISLAAARATDIPYLIASTAKTGEYSYAAQQGIAGLLLERGSCGLCKEEWIEAYCRDLRLLLAHFKMLALKKPEPICSKKVYGETIYLSAEDRGLWYPQVEENRMIKKGDLLGYMEDFYGKRLREYRAEDDGTVFYYSGGLAVLQGDPLVAYGLERSVES